jgi:hypothetical protein
MSKSPQLINDIALTITTMNHNWQVVVVSKSEVAIEPGLLQTERRTIPVAVETGFAYCNHARMSDEVLD